MDLIFIVAIVALGIIAFYIFLYFYKPVLKNVEVKIDDKTFHAEIADTMLSREKGLMFRKEMPKENGMLFVFSTEGTYKFWMLNTSIHLDMIWMDKDKKIIFIQQDAEPCRFIPCKTYGPNQSAAYVLEINANLTKKYGINVGDKASFKLS